VEQVETRPNEHYGRLRAQVMELRAQRQAAVSRLIALEAQGQPPVTELSQLAGWQVDLGRLTRDRDVAEKQYLTHLTQLQDIRVREQAIPRMMELVETAGVPSVPVRPDKIKQVMLAMILGLVLGGAFAFVQEYLDDRITSGEDVERLTGLASLGGVPTIPEGVDRLLIGHNALSPLTESYRRLRTSVVYASIDHPLRSLIVTSPQQGEGKSITSANLSIAMALQNKRIILVDADLRRPRLHRLFNLDSEAGLTKVLAGEISLDEAIQPTPIEGLSIITCGPLPPNPPELLNSQAMLDLMEELKARADIVMIDTPPILPVTDSQVVAGYVDGVVLVVEVGELRKTTLRSAHHLIGRTRARIVGTVLNKADQVGKGYRKGYYRAGYGYGGYGSYGTYGQYGQYGHYGDPTMGAKLGASGSTTPAGEVEPVATGAPAEPRPQLPPPPDWD